MFGIFNPLYSFFQPGFTALHIAAHYGKTNVGSFLIQRGADVNFQAKVRLIINPNFLHVFF